MANTDVNISLQAKTNATINLTTLDGGIVSGASTVTPLISFIATGPQGPSGPQGIDGVAAISVGSITSDHLGVDSVGSSEIIDESVRYEELAVASVRGNRIMPGAITTVRLANESVTQVKLADNSVGAAQIINGTITQELLQDLAVHGDKLDDLSVTAGKLQDLSIITTKIRDRNVTGAKIVSNPDLDGEVKANNLKLKGSSPATITGPDAFSLQLKTNTTLDVLDTSGVTKASIDQSGNLTIEGTVDGRDVAVDGAKLDTISANDAIDWTTDQVATNIHSGNYTDTDTVYAHPTNHAISVTTGLQAALDSKVDDSQVLTDVPSGALFTDTDTVYTHPANHAISVTTGLQTALDGKVDDSQVLTDVPSGALFTDTDTVYTHPANHAISVTTGLQTALDGKVDDGQVLTDVPSGALFTDTNTVYNDTTIQAEVDLNTAKTSNIVQTTITGNAGTASALTSGAKTISGTLDLSGSSSKLVIDNTEVAQLISSVVTIGQTNRVLKLDSSETKILSSTGIQLGHDSDTTIARSGAGTVTVAGKEIQFQGTGAGQYIEYPIRVFDSYSFYIYNDDYWYTLGTTSMALLGSSTAPGNLSSTSSKYQSRAGTYTALEACTLKKLTFTFYWSSSVVNSADIDFGFSKFTPITDGTSATITMNAITATDRNGTYTENAPYQVEFTFSGSNATFAAGDAFAFHMRTTGGSNGQRVIVYGGAVLSIELN